MVNSQITHKVIRVVYQSFLLLSIATHLLYAQAPQQEISRHTTCQAGIRLLEQGQLDAAENHFLKVLKQDNKNAEVYYGLGLVCQKRRPGCTEAIEYFKKAIALKDDYAEAYYHLALACETAEHLLYRIDTKKYLELAVEKDPHLIEAWEKLANLVENITGWPNAKVVKLLSQAVVNNPDHKDLYERLVYATNWHDRVEDLIPVVQLLCKKYPDESRYPLDLAEVYYRQEEYETSLALLDSIETLYSPACLCRSNLIRAKCYFETDRDEAGLEAYWTSVEAIRDSFDIQLLENDLCYLLKDHEYAELHDTPLGNIPSFFNKFWRSRDPNLVTQTNERIPEHYRRLKYARMNYRRYVVFDDFRLFTALYRPEHFRGTPVDEIGDRFLNEYSAKALPKRREIDDMGIIYIRHGEPAAKIFYIGSDSDVPLNASWQYYAKYDRPEMIFHFIKYGGTRGWVIESMPKYFNERAELGGIYLFLDPEVPTGQWPRGETPFELLVQSEEDNVEHVTIGMKTETSDYKFEGEPFDFPFTFLSFKGKRDQTNVDLYFGVEGKEVKIDTSEGDNCLRLSEFLGVYDDDWKEVLNYTSTVTTPVSVTPEEWKKSSGMQMEQFTVPPGAYHCEFHLKDLISDKLGAYKFDYIFPDYWQDSLMMSDIILSGPIRDAAENSPYVKGDIAYTPKMFQEFAKRETIGLYYEIYNLVRDLSGKTNYQVSWTLQKFGSEEEVGKDETKRGLLQRLFGRPKEQVVTSYTYSGSSRDEKMHLNFDIGQRPSGKYDLIVSVKDLNSGEETSKKVLIIVE